MGCYIKHLKTSFPIPKSLIFQNHLTSSSYKNPSFFSKLFTTKSYNQKQKFIKLISTQQHQHFTLIDQESQFTMNDSFSSKLLKQQLHEMEHSWHKSTTTTSHINNKSLNHEFITLNNNTNLYQFEQKSSSTHINIT